MTIPTPTLHTAIIKDSAGMFESTLDRYCRISRAEIDCGLKIAHFTCVIATPDDIAKPELTFSIPPPTLDVAVTE
jgi:hypothetical protein